MTEDTAEAKRKLTEALRAWNGTYDAGPSRDEVKALLDRLEREDREAQIEREVAVRVAAALEAERQAEQELPHRRQMSALAKSRFIRAHGLQAYEALPE